jgi:hypothetical protein
LRNLLQFYTRDMSAAKWGIHDFSWVFVKGHNTRGHGSKVWKNICCNWAVSKSNLRPCKPANVEEWNHLPLWTPHIVHKVPGLALCKTNPQRQIRRKGFDVVEDIVDESGRIILWEEKGMFDIPRSCKRAYEVLTTNLKETPILCDSAEKKVAVYMQEMGGLRVWEYSIPKVNVTRLWHLQSVRPSPVRSFILNGENLVKVENLVPIQNTPMRRILVGKQYNRGCDLANKVRFGEFYGNLRFASQYEWVDGTEFLNTSTQHLRIIQAKPRATQKSLKRWEEEENWTPDYAQIWRETWCSFQAAKENCFLWQLLYRTPATQRWRKPKLSGDADKLTCTRCNLGAVEDIKHCIWSCPNSAGVWEWSQKILRLAAADDSITLDHRQIFLAEEIKGRRDFPKKFWQLLRAVTSWSIWKSRCGHFMEGKKSTTNEII